MLVLVKLFFPHAAVFLVLPVSAVVIVVIWLITRWLRAPPCHMSNVPALPAGAWWTDDSLFQLERRSIFSKTWLCVAHRGRFIKTGDYLSLDLAEFHIFLILGKDGIVRAFHNVCRHRAFPVISHKASGRSTVLACQYHGWTYNTLGQLTNAPHFDQLPTFSKSSNSLFGIHARTDSRGFIHINLNGNDKAAESAMEEAITTGHPSHNISSSSKLIYSWKGTGKFNWKTAGIFNSPEIHTPTLFRSFLATILPTSCSDGHVHYFPVTTVHTKVGRPYWYQIVYLPDSPHQTTVRCDVYTAETTGGSSEFNSDATDRLESHLKLLIQSKERLYASISSGIVPTIDHNENSSTDPFSYLRTEDGFSPMNSAYYARIDALLRAHRHLESIQGRQVHPAAVQHCHSASFEQAENICQAITCSNTELEW